LGYIDWSIIAVVIAVLIGAALKTKNYQKTVADFLVANRCAGRYLLGVSEGIASLGAITVVAMFEAYYKGGFSLIWWGVICNLAMVIVGLSGWVVYRYRETRAMTLAQLLEMRYSRRFRIFAGFVIFISGTLNFGIFPAVGARFFQHFCGFPAINVQIGFLNIDLMLAAIMIVLLGIALLFIFLGGQIVVMITEFIQGILFNIIFCLILVFLLYKMPWSDMMNILSQCPQGQSMVHPFQAGQTEDFNFWFYLIQAFGLFYCVRAWQGNQGYFGAAINAHEARMGNIFGLWRTLTQQFLVFIIPVFAFVFMRHPSFTGLSETVNTQLNVISNPSLQKQLTTTLILSNILPVGLLGAFTVAMICAFISNNDTYMHSWGSIFVQDIIMPLSGKKFQPEKQVKYLKLSITGVAVFAFLFSLLFPQNDYVLMYFAMTGTLWLGGAGVVIIGGLYWKKGSVYGAYGAVVTGIIIAALNFILPRVWAAEGMVFPINSQWLWFIAMISSSVVYVVLSLLHNKNYNLDKLLHRGVYKVQDDVVNDIAKKIIPVWQRITGIDDNFTFVDKTLYLAIAGFIAISALLFICVTIYNLIVNVDQADWGGFWHIFIWVTLSLSVITTIWFFIGSLKDIKVLVYRLTKGRQDFEDDGTVK
jgi:SSS family solute:Na+ symporter